MSVDISLCMVSYNCREALRDCLDSLRSSLPQPTFEIILVDNVSKDGTLEMVKESYPEVTILVNNENVGFLKGTNQAIKASSGRYLLWLNPDTILRPDSLLNMTEALEKRPHAGIVGPKVLNQDGSFQPQCKRGLPTPLASLCYMLHLDRIWPRHHTIGQYLLRYLPEDEPNLVDAVSGSCLMARREMVEDIGLLDEDLKQWGEDIEWCVRAKRKGWEVWYDPSSVIVHLKGKGGRHFAPYRAARDMHSTMWLFYCKYFRTDSSAITTLLVRGGISASLSLSLARIWVGRTFLQK